jgi:hypothetical protein
MPSECHPAQRLAHLLERNIDVYEVGHGAAVTSVNTDAGRSSSSAVQKFVYPAQLMGTQGLSEGAPAGGAPLSLSRHLHISPDGKPYMHYVSVRVLETPKIRLGVTDTRPLQLALQVLEPASASGPLLGPVMASLASSTGSLSLRVPEKTVGDSESELAPLSVHITGR